MLQKKANQMALSMQKPSVPTESTQPMIPFQFTPQAKKCLGTLMSEEHLKEHESNPTLRCHRFRYYDTYKKTEEITRTKLYVLIFMALNHVQSDLQLSDLIRFLREGHVSLQIASSISNDARYNLDFNNRIQKGLTNVPTHSSLRTIASDLAKEIGFQFKETDLSTLCHRYLLELCLPPVIGNLIDIILDACPPSMGNGGESRKNYEGRAMAYILFTLKLLFGLDDNREYLISSSGREINKRISELSPPNDDGVSQQKPLFIWSDWVDYIEMRDIILTQLHCPTAMKTYGHGDGMSTMYLEYLTKTDEKNADVKSTFKPYAKLMQRVRDQFQATYNINPKLNDKLTFYPSLTPKRTYMDEVRYSEQSKVFVPPFMDVAHDECDIEPFLNPSKLQSFFRQHQIKLAVNKLKCNADIDLISGHVADPECNFNRFGNYCLYDYDITTQEWLDQLNKQKSREAKQLPNGDAKKSVEARLETIREYNEIAKEEKRAHRQNNAGEESDSASTNFGENIFDCVSSDEEDDDDDVQWKETLDFCISNYDYYLLFHTFSASKTEFGEFSKKLSKTFQWLLKQGADLVENQELEVYVELMLIEYYFTKNVKPSKKVCDNLLNPLKAIWKINNY